MEKLYVLPAGVFSLLTIVEIVALCTGAPWPVIGYVVATASMAWAFWKFSTTPTDSLSWLRPNPAYRKPALIGLTGFVGGVLFAAAFLH